MGEEGKRGKERGREREREIRYCIGLWRGGERNGLMRLERGGVGGWITLLLMFLIALVGLVEGSFSLHFLLFVSLTPSPSISSPTQPPPTDSRARNLSNQAASSVLSHPLAKPLLKTIPHPITQAKNVEGELLESQGGSYDVCLFLSLYLPLLHFPSYLHPGTKKK